MPRPYDFEGSVRFLPFGLYDPSCRVGPDGLWRAARTPDGPVTLQAWAEGDRARARAWGPGASWAIARVGALLGLADRPADFRPPAGAVAKLARRGRGLHLARTPWVFDVVCQFVLQQRVTFRDAARAHRHLTRQLGEPSPGTGQLLLPLAPRDWLRLSCEAFRRAGVDAQRAGRLRAAARQARLIDRTLETDLETAAATLLGIPGCGPWTAGMVRGFALGDPDAVPVGDLHLPSAVAHALAGEPRADDEGMLELLEPYRGHRFRLIRLLLATNRLRLGPSGR